ncbi:MAG: bifunctional glutamine-synthetase adenylyltransferase/deadenyltransferase, partial [Propionibacterium sp.]|nr:bifunctional glutamine-synthetase adenylyltransferase/deadenyltransferase [Propionibacterium sp.]
PESRDQLAAIARTLRRSVEDLDERWHSSLRDVRRLRQRIFFSPILDVVTHVPTQSLLTEEAAISRLRALGFDDPRSALGHIQALTAGQSRAVEIQRQLMPAMLEWFADGPGPDFGLLSFRQLSEALGESSWYLRALRDEGYMAKRLATVAATSRYVVALLQRAPQSVSWLASPEELVTPPVDELVDAMRAAAARQDDVEGAIGSARAMRRGELTRVALADVLGEMPDAGRALSDIAAATVAAGLEIARRDVDAPEVGVVALGRWGGGEMSYASDIDCMFVVPDGTDGDGLTAATALVRRLSEILGRPGPDPALPIDTGLRPEGKDGPQVRTVGSYAAYYAQWAATWERQMLLRARFGGGARALVDAVFTDVEDFRYPAGGLTSDQVMEIRRLKSRMEKERVPRGLDRGRHLKLGPGGLTDIEWTVQLIQLQHAQEHAGLRVTSTMAALEESRRLGLIGEEDAEALSEGWRHASALRDAIMLVRGRPSDVLPSDVRELAAI